MSQLSVLNLYENYFDGTIPSTFSKLEQLKIYNIAFNFLTGNTNSILSSNSILYYYFSFNYLTGEISFNQLCKSNSLLSLLMNDNKFTGTINSCISNWSSINSIDFSNL